MSQRIQRVWFGTLEWDVTFLLCLQQKCSTRPSQCLLANNAGSLDLVGSD
jgi:hypothetical protein